MHQALRVLQWADRAVSGERGLLSQRWCLEPGKARRAHEPQPDLTVIQPRDYRLSLPGSENVLPLAEVSDTTLTYERAT
jgi:hypothetical protein